MNGTISSDQHGAPGPPSPGRTHRSADQLPVPLPLVLRREQPGYLSEQLITYIGNKRGLLGPIEQALLEVRRRLGGRQLQAIDLFAGSGVVSRLLKGHCRRLISNDFERYAATIGRCYLSNRSEVDWNRLVAAVEQLNRAASDPLPGPPDSSAGFIQRLYAPRDDGDIQPGERVFYTRDNARRIDRYRQLIDRQPPQLRDLLLGPLLSAASVHANTAGVFKGFYKDRRTQVGRFGGSGQDALARILGKVRIVPPVLSRFECDWEVWQLEAAVAAASADGCDLAYLDPPYNQHPYGSNYFMLNLIVDYQPPAEISHVSGIPVDWQRSEYNRRGQTARLLCELLDRLPTPFVLLSFSDDGFLNPAEIERLLSRRGKVQVATVRYNAFRASRSFARRSRHVHEQLYLLER
jgi:adenine-specific DNA-methyltransferase